MFVAVFTYIHIDYGYSLFLFYFQWIYTFITRLDGDRTFSIKSATIIWQINDKRIVLKQKYFYKNSLYSEVGEFTGVVYFVDLKMKRDVFLHNNHPWKNIKSLTNYVKYPKTFEPIRWSIDRSSRQF